MPGMDGTGPGGAGPKTGRQMGKCDEAQPSGNGIGPCGRGMQRGMGRCMGFGRGYGFRQELSLTADEKRKILEAEKASIEKALKEIE